VIVGAALAEVEARLSAAGVEPARREARLLLALALNEPVGSLAREATVLSESEKLRLGSLVSRRVAREPFAFIAGRREFWSIEFEVGPGVLVPRPETETLIEEFCRSFVDRRSEQLEIADFGTGSGCLLVASLSEFPVARGVGFDISQEALAWAKRNIRKHRLDTRATLRHQDWANEMTDRFDAILSNPPYIPKNELMALAPEVARYEPSYALNGGDDGLAAYRSLSPRIAQALKANGLAFLEIGASQAEGVKEVLKNAGLEVDRIVKDLAGNERCVVAHLAHKQEH
jgi:release factor glutamine methyltransferase